MTLMGGIDSRVDRSDASEEEIREEARRVCGTYGEGGYFIPCISYGGEGTIYPHVYDVLSDEIVKFNRENFKIDA